MLPAPTAAIVPAAHVMTAGRPSLLGRTATAWRWPLAAAALVTAAAHVPVTGEHLHEAPYIGVLFILLEIASVILAGLLVQRPTRAALLAVAGVGALAVAALVVSRTVGLPLIGDDIGDWTEPLAVVSLVAESLLVVGGIAALLPPLAGVPARVGIAAGIAVLVAGGIATGVATAVEAAPAATAGHMTSDMPGMDMGLSRSPASAV